jgi:uncharacterized protein YaiE (UPF0345 family)
MSYKNDSLLVISNKYGAASGDAKAMLFQTYDQLRDIVVSGSATDGAGFGTAGSWLWNVARFIAPSSFMSVMGGSTQINIPGTSYWTAMEGGTSTVSGGNSAFGISELGSFPGFPSGAASILSGFGSSDSGYITGAAASIASASDIAGVAGINAAAYASGVASGYGYANSFVIPAAGIISGFGGILQAISPYAGVYGIGGTIIGNLLQGTSSAALSAYQSVTSKIQANADSILENKVKNIETVVKMIDVQNDVVKKMLKEEMEGAKSSVDNISSS